MKWEFWTENKNKMIWLSHHVGFFKKYFFKKKLFFPGKLLKKKKKGTTKFISESIDIFFLNRFLMISNIFHFFFFVKFVHFKFFFKKKNYRFCLRYRFHDDDNNDWKKWFEAKKKNGTNRTYDQNFFLLFETLYPAIIIIFHRKKCIF